MLKTRWYPTLRLGYVERSQRCRPCVKAHSVMGLLTIIRKAKQKEKEMRILMVGLDNAGKTTVVKSLRGEDTSTVSPTLGFSIKSVQYGGFLLNIWDVGGQKSLRAYWRNYFEATDALVWVVDSSDASRLEDCRSELHELLKEERLLGATLLVLANKQDIVGAVSEARLREALQLGQLANRHWKLAGTSAVDGTGVTEALSWLVADVKGRLYLLS